MYSKNLVLADRIPSYEIQWCDRLTYKRLNYVKKERRGKPTIK
jgi:hypothetical protein